MLRTKNNVMVKILVVFHSSTGTTFRLAQSLAEGLQTLDGLEVILRRIPNTPSPSNADWINRIPEATLNDLVECHGIAFGSPVHFAGASSEFSAFFETTTEIWSKHQLEGKPATVFMGAGSGAGKEAALLSIWFTLATHGMILMPIGIRSMEQIEIPISQGNSIFGATSLAKVAGCERPSPAELEIALLQGKAFGEFVKDLCRGRNSRPNAARGPEPDVDVEKRLSDKGITLPSVPRPAGSYKPFVLEKGLVWINQVAYKDGKILNPGRIGLDISDEEAEMAIRCTVLNVLAVLKEACGANWNLIRRCVQITAYLNVTEDYSKHAELLDVASDLLAEILGERGEHARAVVGCQSLPLRSPVELQVVFSLELF